MNGALHGFQLFRAEATKLFTLRSTWVILATMPLMWPLAWISAAQSVGVPADDPDLYYSTPVPVEYEGFEMAGQGHISLVVLGALWAGSEYGRARQIQTTLMAAPNRLRVFAAKALLLAVFAGAMSFLAMVVTIMLTHAASHSGVDPVLLTPGIWKNLGDTVLVWILTALSAFAIGTIARTSILPMILLIPMVAGAGYGLTMLWNGVSYLPVLAGTAMYTYPVSGKPLDHLVIGLVESGWTAAFLIVAGICFARRDA